jgi:hypothetical protein
MVIYAKVGPGATGDVTVTTPAGTASASGFTFIPPPKITSFTPTHGHNGDTITIRGSYFYDLNNGLDGGVSITFGGVSAVAIYGDSTTIIVIIGPGASGDVTVKNLAGAGSLSGFTYDIVTAVGNVIPGSKELKVYPNPASDYFVIEHPMSNKTATIQCIDPSGRIVKRISVAQGASKTDFNTKDLLSGVYQIAWSDGKNSLTKTVMILK